MEDVIAEFDYERNEPRLLRQSALQQGVIELRREREELRHRIAVLVAENARLNHEFKKTINRFASLTARLGLSDMPFVAKPESWIDVYPIIKADAAAPLPQSEPDRIWDAVKAAANS